MVCAKYGNENRIRVVVTATAAADIADTRLYELEVTGQ
jgi:hypothetical protein